MDIIRVYTNIGSASCRKTVDWFTNHHIPFQEIKVNHDGVDKSQLKEILRLSVNGLDDILKRNVDRESFNDLSLNAALDRIVANPKLMRVPIIICGKNMQIGYRVGQIEAFTPRNYRELQLVI